MAEDSDSDPYKYNTFGDNHVIFTHRPGYKNYYYHPEPEYVPIDKEQIKTTELHETVPEIVDLEEVKNKFIIIKRITIRRRNICWKMKLCSICPIRLMEIWTNILIHPMKMRRKMKKNLFLGKKEENIESCNVLDRI